MSRFDIFDAIQAGDLDQIKKLKAASQNHPELAEFLRQRGGTK